MGATFSLASKINRFLRNNEQLSCQFKTNFLHDGLLSSMKALLGFNIKSLKTLNQFSGSGLKWKHNLIEAELFNRKLSLFKN